MLSNRRIKTDINAGRRVFASGSPNLFVGLSPTGAECSAQPDLANHTRWLNIKMLAEKVKEGRKNDLQAVARAAAPECREEGCRI